MIHNRQSVSRYETYGGFCIVPVQQEEYSRWYIVQALFKLMNEYSYEKINVTDIVAKAGVGRATFYRYFKNKEDVIIYYFEHHKKEFVFSQHLYPRCREDYIKIVTRLLEVFRQQIEPFRLIRRAHLEYIYLDYLNRNFIESFEEEDRAEKTFSPYLYAGMLFNVSMKWLDDGCSEPEEELAGLLVDAIYFEERK